MGGSIDGSRFDTISRLIARGMSRRGAMRSRLGGIVAESAGSIQPGVVLARNCRANGGVCIANTDCCSRTCGPKDREGQRHCVACESGIICGDSCCPPIALNACGEGTGPGGRHPRCVCPCETTYNAVKNSCDPIDACRNDDDCCSGKCCAGVCCAEGQDLCCGGVCATEEPAFARPELPAAAAQPVPDLGGPTPPGKRAARIPSCPNVVRIRIPVFTMAARAAARRVSIARPMAAARTAALSRNRRSSVAATRLTSIRNAVRMAIAASTTFTPTS